MPIMKESPRRGTKCYIHEMQRPIDLPYQPLQYHICRICQSRMLELAKADFQFKLRTDVVTISLKPEIDEAESAPAKSPKAGKTAEVKETV